MTIFKCKMCGGDLEIITGENICECQYCGSKQTVPNLDDDKKAKLYERANKLRFNCNFDKATTVYESIINEYPDEAEAYWGLCLSNYGIEYVDDPATGKKVPTCHRSSFDSFMEDTDFEMVMENSDALSRSIYREQAKQIEEVRKGIIEVSGKEQPYDIFICYKETEEDGQRTIDSVIAQDVYDALTDKGYRVFFSRISLEDKLGQKYEPYIFAALNSAKVMLAFGTSYDHYNAVWVKNEWSRFLKLMALDKGKHLIPCYKDIDAYDIPKEFRSLQAQDLGKVGAVQDLLRGIDKIFGRSEALTQQGQTQMIQQVVASGTNIDALLKRGYDALEDGAFDEANKFFDEVLSGNAESSEAYLGLFMAEIHCGDKESAYKEYVSGDYTDNRYWNRAKKYARNEIADEIDRWESERIVRLKSEAEKKAQLQRDEEVAFLERKAQLLKKRRRNAPVQEVLEAKYVRTLGLRSDGTVVAVGANFSKERNVNNWENIIAISAGGSHTVGLKSNGTVVAVGQNKFGQCNVDDWKDIIAISAGGSHTVGLKSNGTVVAVGQNEFGQCNVDNWKGIIAINSGDLYTVGLKSDGTVVAVGYNVYGQCNVNGWKDIIAISVYGYTVGLKSDGTVVAVGDNDYGRCNVNGWKDIIAIGAGLNHTVGLKLDGTVVAVGDNKHGQCNVNGWKDIIAISVGGNYTVGLNPDGTVVAVGDNRYGQCNVNKWKLFNSLDTLDTERKEAAERKLTELSNERNKLNEELSTLKGLFAKSRRKQIESRLKEIDKYLK